MSKDLEEAISRKYGFKGEDWEGGEVTIRGVKKYYAVKSPSASTMLVFNKANTEHFTKLALNKISKTDMSQFEKNLVIDCLIVDVDGCASYQDFEQDSDVKPQLVSKLKDVVYELAESGLEGLKKSV